MYIEGVYIESCYGGGATSPILTGMELTAENAEAILLPQVISRNPTQSDAIRRPGASRRQRSSVAISLNSQQSVAISGNQ